MALKDRLASIGDNIFAALIYAGGAAVITAVSASTYAQGLPLYLIIFWVLVCLLAFAFAANYISIILVRQAKDKRESQDKWLREIAEKDKRDVGDAIRLIDCSFDEHDFSSDTPRVTFRFTIFNGSVYVISIDEKIGGHISYGKRRLKGDLTMSLKWRVDNIPRHYIAYIVFTQWLSKDEADFIANDPNNYHFSFEHLLIAIVDGESAGVIPKPLRFSSFNGIGKGGQLR